MLRGWKSGSRSPRLLPILVALVTTLTVTIPSHGASTEDDGSYFVLELVVPVIVQAALSACSSKVMPAQAFPGDMVQLCEPGLSEDMVVRFGEQVATTVQTGRGELIAIVPVGMSGRAIAQDAGNTSITVDGKPFSEFSVLGLLANTFARGDVWEDAAQQMAQFSQEMADQLQDSIDALQAGAPSALQAQFLAEMEFVLPSIHESLRALGPQALALPPELLDVFELRLLPGNDLDPADQVRVLLVDDDDNQPDMRRAYTDALDNLNVRYRVWDTRNSTAEPGALDLQGYRSVI